MGLLDMIKNTVGNLKDGYAEAMAMDIRTLCGFMKTMKKLDPKFLAYRSALSEKLGNLTEAELDAFYKEIQKQGNIFKKHPAQEVVEAVLVEREMYIRDEETGTITRNSWKKW